MSAITFQYNVSADWKTIVITGYEGIITGDITIPSEIDGFEVTAIEAYAFYYCDGLNNVIISNGITSIGTCAFGYCADLTSVTIPNSITNIGNWAFDGCDKLTKVYLYKGSYADGWFVDGVKVYLGNGGGNEGGTSTTYTITYDANGGYSAPSKQTVTEGEWVNLSYDTPTRDGYTFIGWSVWCDTTSIDYYPGDSYYVEDDLYLYAVWEKEGGNEPPTSGDFEYSVSPYDLTVTITGYNGSGGDVVIPSTLNGYTVTDIGERAFDSETTITSLTIPNTIERIGLYAFSGCSILDRLYISDLESWLKVELKGTASHPFIGSTVGNLYIAGELATEITIPNSVTNIGNGLFCNCRSLKRVTISEGITGVGQSVFYFCTSLESVTLPRSLETIERRAFSTCRKLTSVTIKDNVTSIGELAFEDCRDLMAVVSYSKETVIDATAFEGCSSLFKIGCYYNSTTDYYFSDEEYTKLYLDEFSPEEDFGFNRNTGTITGYYGSETNVRIPPKIDGYDVVEIGWNALGGNDSIEYVTIPDTVRTIKEYAFEDCDNLVGVTIGSGVTSINESAFARCPELAWVVFYTKNVTIDSWAFVACDVLKEIRCYKNSSVDEYFSDDEYTKIYHDDEVDSDDYNDTEFFFVDDTGLISKYVITPPFGSSQEYNPGSSTIIIDIGEYKVEAISERSIVAWKVIFGGKEYVIRSGYSYNSNNCKFNYESDGSLSIWLQGFKDSIITISALTEYTPTGGGTARPTSPGKYRVLINGVPAKWKGSDGNYYYMYVEWTD